MRAGVPRSKETPVQFSARRRRNYTRFPWLTSSSRRRITDVHGPDPGAGYIANGGLSAARTFFVSFCIDTTVSSLQQRFLGCNTMNNATTGDVAWLALDDSGAGPNNDHDDWVGYVSVTALPVPDGGVTMGLLGAALLGLSALRQKFNA